MFSDYKFTATTQDFGENKYLAFTEDSTIQQGNNPYYFGDRVPCVGVFTLSLKPNKELSIQLSDLNIQSDIIVYGITIGHAERRRIPRDEEIFINIVRGFNLSQAIEIPAEVGLFNFSCSYPIMTTDTFQILSTDDNLILSFIFKPCHVLHEARYDQV